MESELTFSEGEAVRIALLPSPQLQCSFQAHCFGVTVVRLAPGNPGWRFTAVDPSPAMLDVARERVTAGGLSQRVDLVEGYADDLPATEAYDAATLLLVQHFLPDDGAKLNLLRAIANRLKPGASLILANMHGDLAQPATRTLYQGWKRRQMAAGMSASSSAVGWPARLPTGRC